MLNFDWLSGVSMTVAKWVFLVLFLVIGGLVLMVPTDYVFEGVVDRRWWKDLRLWAIGVLAVIFATYSIF